MAMIHVNRGASSLGAFPEEDVRAGLRTGRFVATDLGWKEGMANWKPLSQFSEFAADFSAPAAGALPPATAVAAPVASQTAVKNEPLAIWSLVLSIISFACCGPVLAVPGVICGHLALTKFQKDSALQGKGLANAGLIIGYVSIGFWILWIIFFGGLSVLESIFHNNS